MYYKVKETFWLRKKYILGIGFQTKRCAEIGVGCLFQIQSSDL